VKIVDAAAPASGRGQARDKSSVSYYRPKIDAAPPEQAAVPRPARDRSAISDATIQRQRDQQQRKLDNDLKTERARLAKEQQGELRSQSKGPGADEVRKRHAAEQQAFEAHAAQQRKVLDQRMQKKIVKPDKTKPADKPAPDQGKDKGQDKEKDKGNGSGN
jgi:hypothetical protein